MKLPFVVGAGLIALLAFGIARHQSDDTTPEGALRGFLDALNAKDYVKAHGFLDVDKPADSSLPLAGLPAAQYQLKSIKTFGSGDEVVLGAEIGIADRPTVLSDLFRLKNIGGHWRIETLQIGQLDVPPPSLIAAFLASTPAAPQKAAASAVCLSNVKQLALGNLMYANDYDDKMPPSSNWKSDIMPYVKSQDLFHCPEDKRGPKTVSYRMSDHLSGVNSVTIAAPASTVMIYEGEGGYLMPRHDNKGSIAYADGHAKQGGTDLFKQGFHK